MRIDYDYNTLTYINKNVDLVEYIGQYLDLKKKGKDYFAKCPRHEDTIPSLSVNPEKNMYYCFSCGKSGGIINYLMDYEGLSFPDAVKKGAALANVDLDKMCKSQTILYLTRIRRKTKEKRLREEYHEILDKSELKKYSYEFIPEWLEEGIRQDVMDLFKIRVDKWNNRIVYPVYDTDGNLINIKGRTRYKDYKELKIPKYINYFPIGTMDYLQGLNITAPYIKEKNEMIIFESLKSVMKAYGWGFQNVVSAEKHMLTEEQLRLIIKLKVNVVFAYDSDVDYREKSIKEDIDKLKRVTNVYVIEDTDSLLGGVESKNAPVDLGKTVWEQLYKNKRKIV